MQGLALSPTFFIPPGLARVGILEEHRWERPGSRLKTQHMGIHETYPCKPLWRESVCATLPAALTSQPHPKGSGSARRSPTWAPMDRSHLVPHVANHITSPLRPTGTGIPVHGTLSCEHTTSRPLHRHRDFVTTHPICGLLQVLHHHIHHIHRRSRMPSHRQGERVIAPPAIAQPHSPCLLLAPR